METGTDYRLKPGDPAPPFRLRGTDGKEYTLDDFRTPLLVVAFWCNHCPYVRAWEDRTIEAARRWGPRGVSWVAINSNDEKSYPEDGFSSMVERARSKNYPFPYLRDETQDVAREYGALVTPQFFLFDPSRRLRFEGAFDDRHDRPDLVQRRYLEEAIESLLKGSLPRDPLVPSRGCSIKWRG